MPARSMPLVGRDEELDLLMRRWRQAKAGEGRVVLISGEPGIGKSRLLAALEEQLAAEPHTSLRYFCSPHHQDSPLYPIAARMEQEAGFVRGDSAAERLAKLEAVLAPPHLRPMTWRSSRGCCRYRWTSAIRPRKRVPSGGRSGHSPR